MLVAAVLVLALFDRDAQEPARPARPVEPLRATNVDLVAPSPEDAALELPVEPPAPPPVASEPAPPEQEPAPDPAPARPPSRVLRGVVRWPDGAPAAGVHVVADHRLEPDVQGYLRVSFETRTDASGRFELHDLEYVPFEVTARPDPAARASEPGHVWAARSAGAWPGEELALTLVPQIVLRGRVVDDRGEPVERFQVVAAPASDGDRALRRAPLERGFRSESGDFELLGLVANSSRVVARSTQHVQSLSMLVVLPDEGPGVTLMVQRFARVAGRAVDAWGAPVADARVSAHHFGSRFGPHASARTGADGSFVLRRVPPGAVKLGCSDDATMLHLAPGEERNVELVVERPGMIEGIARDATGGPAAGATVALSPHDGAWTRDAPIDSRGRFRFTSLADGRYAVALLAGSSGVSVAREIVDVSDGETERVVLGRSAHAKIRVEGDVRFDGEPLEECHVRFAPPGAPSFATETETDADGRYALELAVAGEYVVTAHADYLSYDVLVRRATTVPASEAHRVDVEFVTGMLAGSVRDESGRPLADAAVFVTSETFGNAGYVRLTTDEGGRWRVGVPAGTWDVVAAGLPGYAQPPPREGLVVLADEETGGIDFVLRAELDADESLAVAGRILDERGTPLEGADVRSFDPEQVEWTRHGKSALGGFFELRGTRSPDRELFASWRGLVTPKPLRVLSPVAQVELVVEPGGWLGVRSFDAFEGHADVEIEVFDARGRSWGERDTRWTRGPFFGPLPPGRYVVRASSVAGTLVESDVAVDVAAGAATRVELRLE